MKNKLVRTAEILSAIAFAYGETAYNNGVLPGKVTSFYTLVKQYRKDITKEEFDEFMHTYLDESLLWRCEL